MDIPNFLPLEFVSCWMMLVECQGVEGSLLYFVDIELSRVPASPIGVNHQHK